MSKAIKIERRGRPKKPGRRTPSGRLAGDKCTFADFLFPLLHDCMAIYVMECGEAVKIGVSANPKVRIKSIQTGTPHVVKAVWRRWLQRADATKLEREVHKDLRASPFHAVGETYWMDADRAIQMVERKIKAIGVRSWSEEYFDEKGRFR